MFHAAWDRGQCCLVENTVNAVDRLGDRFGIGYIRIKYFNGIAEIFEIVAEPSAEIIKYSNRIATFYQRFRDV